MDKMLYTAASGASRIMASQNIRANNLANAETIGFKADIERVASMALPQLEGTLDTRVMVETQDNGFNIQSGEQTHTGRKLDLSIQDKGLFTVQVGNGVAYTRAGGMVADSEGQLTIAGRPVMGVGGPIVLPEYKDLFIGENGSISILPSEGGLIQQIGQLNLVNPEMTQMEKGTDGLLRSITGEELGFDETVQVNSGFLEASNVKPVSELIASMDLNRQFEIQVKLMKSAEKLAQAGNKLLRS